MAEDKKPLIWHLKKLGKTKEAYDAYAANESVEDLKNYLAALPGFPAEKSPNSLFMFGGLMKSLKELHSEVNPEIKNSFKQIQVSRGKILRKNVHPEAALLQNIITSTLDRVVSLADSKGTDKTEQALARYVADLRVAIKDLNDINNTYDALKGDVDKHVNAEVEKTLSAVRETVQELCPDKFVDFQKLLLSKLTGSK